MTSMLRWIKIMPVAPNIFMVGWEYPPHNSGGLGVACDGLTRALSDQGTQIYFTLPYAPTNSLSHMQVLACADPKNRRRKCPPFAAYTHNQQVFTRHDLSMQQQVDRYAKKVGIAAQKQVRAHDLLHAHDWMSFPAGIKAKQKTGKPLVAHIHSTEFDRIPKGNGNTYIHQVEKDGLQAADKIVAVSEYTRQVLTSKYSIPADKIEVVHNGVDPLKQPSVELIHFAPNRPLIVFMGRLTQQKGAQYFISVAEQVLSEVADALFVIAGSGEEYQSLLFKAAGSKLSASVLFSGFLRGRDKDILLSRTDVFVMPSLSEPFGIVALEAAQRNIPVIVSANSGVSEVLKGAIKVDFWNVEAMAKQILQLLQDDQLRQKIISEQSRSVSNLSWQRSALKLRKIYSELL